jgi:hypothetical protein
MAADGSRGSLTFMRGNPTLKGAANGLVPTPRALDATGVRGVTPNRTPEANARAGLTLTDYVTYWPTPTAADGKGGPGNQGRQGGMNLRTAVKWATPKATDADRGGRGDLIQQVRGNESPSGHFKTPTAAPFSHGGSGGELHKQVAPSGGPLNPQWVAWLMGFPIDWTSLPPSATPSSRRSRSGSATASSNGKAA